MELDFAATAAVVGGLLPLVISFVKDMGKAWSVPAKKYVALGLSVAAATIAVGTSEGWSTLDFGTVAASWAIIYPMAQTTYKGFWDGSKVEQGLAAVGANGSG
jgi:hypothetical protein